MSGASPGSIAIALTPKLRMPSGSLGVCQRPAEIRVSGTSGRCSHLPIQSSFMVRAPRRDERAGRSDAGIGGEPTRGDFSFSASSQIPSPTVALVANELQEDDMRRAHIAALAAGTIVLFGAGVGI